MSAGYGEFVGSLKLTDKYDKEEWREMTRPLWPEDWDDDTFDHAWNEFVRTVKSH